MRTNQFRPFVFNVMTALAASIGVFVISPVSMAARDTSGAVYVMTNAPSNSVVVFHRNDDGTLTQAGSFSTHGAGSGSGVDPLGSQGALTLTSDHRLLLAVNAGSNDISIFGVRGDQLQFFQRISSYGTKPVSISVHDELVYVLNAGGTPNIAGFRIEPRINRMFPLPGSTRALAGGVAAGAAQVSFSPDGAFLVVTEKATNTIDTYLVGDDGYASGPTSNASSGATPFGFQFARNNVPIVSEAAGGAGGTSALSSYDIADDGTLSVVTPSIGDTQKAACWVVVTADRSYAYTSNSASNSISSYSISPSGSLGLLNVAAASTGAGTTPIDIALSTGDHYFYTLNAGNGTVSGFRVESDGSLTPVGMIGGLSSGVQGIAAR